MTDFQDNLQTLINQHSQENGSNTPDFILASYLNDCLKAYNSAVTAREAWYGRTDNPITTAPPAQQSPRVCVKCGHRNRRTDDGLCQVWIYYGDTDDPNDRDRQCGCKCIFPESVEEP